VFCQMILNGGEFGGKRYITDGAVRQMTSTQTADLISKGKGENGYGLGWQTTRIINTDFGTLSGACGHGGAYATDMWIDPEQNLVMVFMVQHNGFAGPDGGNIRPAFRKAAVDAFGKK